MLDLTWVVATAESVFMVAFSALFIYLALIVYTRIAGLRSFSKMSSFDFAVTIAFGSVIASTILTSNPPLLQGVIGLGILYVIQYTISVVRERSDFVRTLVDNEPILLMDGPRLLQANMKTARMTESDLRAKLREANVTRMDQIKAVVLETTGDVSVLHGDPDAPALDGQLLHGVRGAERLQ